MIGRISCNFDGYKSVLDELDQLRAEVEALKNQLWQWKQGANSEAARADELRLEVEALRKDAERYRNWRAIGVRAGAAPEEFDFEWDKAIEEASQ